MNKLMLFSLLFLALNMKLIAQSPSYVKYFNKEKIEVSNKDSAAFSRLYYQSDTVKNSFLIKEYYKNANVKMIGELFFKNGVEYFQGKVNYYNENGVLREIIDYKEGYKLGSAYSFYPNRKLRKEIIYKYDPHHDFSLMVAEKENIHHDNIFAKGHLMEYTDSSGLKLITEGKGYIKENVSSFGEEIVEEGQYVNGLKEGEWKLTTKDKVYLENFKNGTLINGTLILKGKRKKYSTALILPKFKVYNTHISGYGMKRGIYPISLHEYLINIGFKYADKKTEGNYTVKPQFNVIIDDKGKYVDLEMISLVPDQVTAELKKEIKKINFSAGIYRGQKITMKLPINWLPISYPSELL